MKYYIISDTHFGHALLENVYDRPHGFEIKILKQLHALPKDAVLIHLGDICIGNDAKWHRELAELDCKKILVKGNHDRKSDHWYYEHGRDAVCESMELKVQGHRVLLTHIPVPERKDGYNIHGHLHNRFNKDKLRGDGCRCYSCEFEKYKPRTIESILTELQIGIYEKTS